MEDILRGLGLQNYYRRAILEALEIQREEVCNSQNSFINDRAGLYVTTDTWKPFFNNAHT